MPAGGLVFSDKGRQAAPIFCRVRDTTVQVWTVREGLGIGSKFTQTCCLGNNFRDHEVLLPRLEGTGD